MCCDCCLPNITIQDNIRESKKFRTDYSTASAVILLLNTHDDSHMLYQLELRPWETSKLRSISIAHALSDRAPVSASRRVAAIILSLAEPARRHTDKHRLFCCPSGMPTLHRRLIARDCSRQRLLREELKYLKRRVELQRVHPIVGLRVVVTRLQAGHERVGVLKVILKVRLGGREEERSWHGCASR